MRRNLIAMAKMQGIPTRFSVSSKMQAMQTALQAKRPQPATTQSMPAEAAPSAPGPSGKRKIKRISKEKYNELLIQLKEAEDTAKMWYDEVEAAREQLEEAEALRDRYLRILQQCYDRTSQQSSVPVDLHAAKKGL